MVLVGTVRRRRRLRRLRRLCRLRLRKLFTFSTSSQKPLHRSISNFTGMYSRWMSTKFVKIGVLPPFSEELWVILCNFQSL